MESSLHNKESRYDCKLGIGARFVSTRETILEAVEDLDACIQEPRGWRESSAITYESSAREDTGMTGVSSCTSVSKISDSLLDP